MNLKHNKSSYFVTPDTVKDIETKNVFVEWSSKLFKAFQDIYDDLNLFRTSIGGSSFGDELNDGSWRIVKVGDNLEVQRRESGTWNAKHTYTP